jgi:pSer/pThr/pTyr-binding forkhead associated (FHA) protein
MDLHQNARSCPASRAVLVRRVVEEGWRVKAAAPSAFAVVIGEREVRLLEGENSIGRGTDVRAHLDSMEVSRHHARILVTGARAVLEDLGSMNGTVLRDQRIKGPTQLEDRDVIVIGGISLVFREMSRDGSTIPAGNS